ncbi:MAG: alpha/beta hydrolase-fold protein [Planctomycetota bacterium]
MHRVFLLAIVALLPAITRAQSPPDPNYVREPIFDTYEEFRAALDAATGLADTAERTAAVDALWNDLTDAGQVPFAIGDQAAFLYRGSASSVSWRGDFNRWGEAPGVRLGQSDIWLLERTFPSDARTDYKVFVNGFDWKLDPDNPLEMWGGFGPNSEFRMPDYQYPHETIRRPGITEGNLSPPIRLATDNLPHDLNYQVYTPPGYDAEGLANLPTVYVTDGHEYAADHMGSMTAVMDNLINEGKLAPAIAVFIDPRRPDTGQNVRAELYLGNTGFADFLADELMPTIDDAYRTDARPESRTILGTSFGGFFSAFFGAYRDDAVRNIVMQSPFLVPELIDVWADNDLRFQNVVMTGGTFGDDSYADSMAAALIGAGYDFRYMKVDDGHSWGAWRGQLDELLLATVGAPIPEPATGAVLAAGLLVVAFRRPSSRALA